MGAIALPSEAVRLDVAIDPKNVSELRERKVIKGRLCSGPLQRLEVWKDCRGRIASAELRRNVD